MFLALLFLTVIINSSYRYLWRFLLLSLIFLTGVFVVNLSPSYYAEMPSVRQFRGGSRKTDWPNVVLYIDKKEG